MGSPFNTMFLDIGGVLLTNGWDHEIRRRTAEHFDLEYEEMNDRHQMTFDAYESGKLALDRYLDRVVFYRERSFSRDGFKEFMFNQSRPYPETIDLLLSVKSRHHLRVAAVSNEGRELTEHRVQTFRLDRLIDFFICSAFVHLRKPDEDIYRLALDVSQARPEQVVYLEDRLMFVQVAQGLGIRSIHHRGLEPTRSALADLGLG
jgi:putative hydrolase of the HAD superfamily